MQTCAERWVPTPARRDSVRIWALAGLKTVLLWSAFLDDSAGMISITEWRPMLNSMTGVVEGVSSLGVVMVRVIDRWPRLEISTNDMVADRSPTIIMPASWSSSVRSVDSVLRMCCFMGSRRCGGMDVKSARCSFPERQHGQNMLFLHMW